MSSNITLEYVRITPPEQVYANKQFLYSQLGILSLMQRYAAYEAYRVEELSLKINLKKLIDEMKTELKLLESVLPKIENERDNKKVKTSGEELHSLRAEEKVLEREIEEIKRRLARMQ